MLLAVARKLYSRLLKVVIDHFEGFLLILARGRPFPFLRLVISSLLMDVIDCC